MRNIEIALKSDYSNGSGDLFKMYFRFSDTDEIEITTINKKDNSQHDFALTKDEYLFLRQQFDNYFNINLI